MTLQSRLGRLETASGTATEPLCAEDLSAAFAELDCWLTERGWTLQEAAVSGKPGPGCWSVDWLRQLAEIE